MITQHFLKVPTHPILWCTGAYILGILSMHHGTKKLLFFCAFLIILALTLVFLARNKHSRTLLVSLFLLLSFFFGSYRYTQSKTFFTYYSTFITQSPLEITATVSQIERIYGRTGHQACTTLATKSVRNHKDRLNTSINLRMYSTNYPDLQVGDSIVVHNVTFKPSNNQTYQDYLFKEGIVASNFTRRLSYTLLHRPRVSFARARSRIRKQMNHSLSKKMSPPTYALTCALFLGTKPPGHGSTLMRNQCTWWGIVHYLARSGLHVILIIYAWNLVLRRLMLPFMLKEIILIALICLYHLLTWPSISFMRALITFLLYKACTLQNLSFQTLHILSLTTLLVLIYNPLQLFFLDFQLSFFLTFALAWFNEVQIKKRHSLEHNLL